jgi:asparaginyl-tRNA synthetase
MPTRLEISALAASPGTTVAVQGWVLTTRSSGKIAFVVIRDGSGYLQGVLAKAEVSDATWERFQSLTQETCVRLEGEVRADQRSPGGVELAVRELEILGPSVDFPITPKEHGTPFLLDHRHLWLRSRRQVAIMKIRHEIIQGIRDFFDRRGFFLVDTPILTGSIGESGGTLFETEYFDLGKAYLAQTGQLYVEAACAALGKVYCFGPTFRAEKSKTRRHLTEFWMVEPEVAFNTSDDNMRLQEEFIVSIVARVLDRRAEELKELERDTAKLASVVAPFPRVPYSQAVELLRAMGSSVTWGSDLGAEDETLLAGDRDRPLFVYNYPRDVKAFYMKENPDDPRTVLCDDCLAPEGYGEIIGGSQREDDHQRLLARIREQGLPEAAYGWYLDLRTYGTFVHSGFGLGLERTVAWICGLEHIREAIAFPRTIYRITP